MQIGNDFRYDVISSQNIRFSNRKWHIFGITSFTFALWCLQTASNLFPTLRHFRSKMSFFKPEMTHVRYDPTSVRKMGFSNLKWLYSQYMWRYFRSKSKFPAPEVTYFGYAEGESRIYRSSMKIWSVRARQFCMKIYTLTSWCKVYKARYEIGAGRERGEGSWTDKFYWSSNIIQTACTQQRKAWSAIHDVVAKVWRIFRFPRPEIVARLPRQQTKLCSEDPNPSRNCGKGLKPKPFRMFTRETRGGLVRYST